MPKQAELAIVINIVILEIIKVAGVRVGFVYMMIRDGKYFSVGKRYFSSDEIFSF